MGRVFALIGATGRLGRALCRKLQASDVRLVVGSRDERRLATLACDFDALPVSMAGDVGEGVAACIAAALERHGRLDGVINLATSFVRKAPHRLHEAEWNAILEFDLGSAFHVIRSAAPAMSGRGGSIVLLTSSAAREGLPGIEAVAVARAGVEALVRCSARTYATDRIRINGVSLGTARGPVRTTEHLRDPGVVDALGDGREPEEVATAIEWLLRPEQSSVTGKVLGIAKSGAAKVAPADSSLTRVI